MEREKEGIFYPRWSIDFRLALIGFLVAALIGGVAGGLIVSETSDSGNGSAETATARGSNGTAAACPAATVADRALPSVVTVRAGNVQAGGSGSGVVIRPGGYILTKDHVISVAAGGGTVSILRSNGEPEDATIVGRDPLTDLAVVKARADSDLPAIEQGESGSLLVGQPVVALGSPLGLTSTVTGGIVSALNRYVRLPSDTGQTAHLVGAIQTDASINPGTAAAPSSTATRVSSASTRPGRLLRTAPAEASASASRSRSTSPKASPIS